MTVLKIGTKWVSLLYLENPKKNHERRTLSGLRAEARNVKVLESFGVYASVEMNSQTRDIQDGFADLDQTGLERSVPNTSG